MDCHTVLGFAMPLAIGYQVQKRKKSLKKKKKIVQMHYRFITMCYRALATTCTPARRTFTLNVSLDTSHDDNPNHTCPRALLG